MGLFGKTKKPPTPDKEKSEDMDFKGHHWTWPGRKQADGGVIIKTGSDLTMVFLQEIRDELKGQNKRIDLLVAEMKKDRENFRLVFGVTEEEKK